MVAPAQVPELKPGTARRKLFTFSLRYWRQPDHFGLSGLDVSWFVSLLERLSELGAEEVSRFIEDRDFKSAIRYHVVDWDARGIPLKSDQLDWLPRDVRENPVEFPIVQFHISKAKGRVHGFWDSERCFQVVLLDPLHNLQPSKDVGYKIRPTSVASCELSSLRVALDRACQKPCLHDKCGFAEEIRVAMTAPLNEQFAVLAGLTDDVAHALSELRKNRVVSVSEIVETGIIVLEDSCSGGKAVVSTESEER